VARSKNAQFSQTIAQNGAWPSFLLNSITFLAVCNLK